jgi:glycosyltransferase involved in cell wall biosynthesis
MRAAGDDAALRLLVTVTFNNNQLVSHLAPIVTLPSVGRITLVADHAGPPLPKVHTVVPPVWLKRLLGRAGAKLVVCALLARRERPDWVIAFSLVPHGINGWIAARLAGASSVCHVIGGQVEWQGGGWRSGNRIMSMLPRPSATIERFLLRVIRSYTVVVTMGERARGYLLESGIGEDRVLVIPPSVAVVESVDGRREGDERYDIVWMGRLVSVKRLEDLLDAIAPLRERYPGFRAALAGVGPLERALRERCRRLEIAGNVDFVGFQHPATLRKGDIFVLTSETEGLSIAMLEAMACGLPVVVTDVGELGELVRDGENGYLIEVGDVQALTERLDRLMSDPSLRQRLGETARRDARRYASVERIASIYEEMLTAPVVRASERAASAAS